MKKPRKARRTISFEVGRVFPPDDDLAIDLLRLMAFHDDLSFVGDFMRANLNPPVQSTAKQVAASRFFFLQRLFGAVVAELVKVLHNMKAWPRFTELTRALDADGQATLEILLSVPFDEDHEIYGPLYRARNKAGFHFDHNDFAAAIRTFLQRYGADAKSSFVAEPKPDEPRRSRTYYMLADQIAIQTSFGLPAPGDEPDAHAALLVAVDLYAALRAQSWLTAVCATSHRPRLRSETADALSGTFSGTSGGTDVDGATQVRDNSRTGG